MVDTELFEVEMTALMRAQEAAAKTNLDAGQYRHALVDLVQHFQRLMRETHRLIRHGDRTEAELNTVNAKLRQLSAELDYKARYDNLTGTLNRGAVFEQAQRHLRETSLSVIILDIDYFKRINDTFGHPTGDAVICELVDRLAATLAGRGEIGRVGGEEFTILLPGTALQESAFVAESIRQHIAGKPFLCLPSSHPVTASFGVSWNVSGTAFDLAYSNTDAALYQAKNLGRNQVVAY
ncbi:diguanylate cyclase OS=Eoetvoesiella caeni OX=645616 GN=DFR37_103253 PE=4 SV=1 [Eoetvoesiella caeni]